jgi:hypothetical protein
MDEREFDEVIRGKVSEYEAPGFDPAALAALHHRLAAADPVSWYGHYRTEIIAAAATAAVCIFLGTMQWYGSRQEERALQSHLRSVNERLTGLEERPDRVSYPDTVFILRESENSAQMSSLTFEILRLRKETENLQNQNRELLRLLTRFVAEPSAPHDTVAVRQFVPTSSAPLRVLPHEIDRPAVKALPRGAGQPDLNNQSTKLSVRTMRDLERHYRKGIGLRIGPTLESSVGNYSEGVAEVSFTGGAVADVLVSPSLSVEAGAKLGRRYYEISDAQSLAAVSLPGTHPSGTLSKAEMDYKVLELPVGLKYRYPLSLKSQVTAGLGYSALLFRKQVFEYSYKLPGMEALTFTSIYEVDQPAFYPGFVNVNLGLNAELKNRKIIETSLYYQFGTGRQGAEQITADFAGLRAVYWFKVR